MISGNDNDRGAGRDNGWTTAFHLSLFLSRGSAALVRSDARWFTVKTQASSIVLPRPRVAAAFNLRHATSRFVASPMILRASVTVGATGRQWQSQPFLVTRRSRINRPITYNVSLFSLSLCALILSTLINYLFWESLLQHDALTWIIKNNKAWIIERLITRCCSSFVYF